MRGVLTNISVSIVIILLFSSSLPATQVFDTLQLDQLPSEFSLDPNEFISLKFWRANPNIFNIVDSNIFPLAALLSDNNFENLGKAWITWTIEIDGQYLAAYALFNRGRISEFILIETFYEEISWFAVDKFLILVTVGFEKTIFTIIEEGEEPFQYTELFSSTRHQLFAVPGKFQFFMMVNGTDAKYLQGEGEGLELLTSLTIVDADKIIISSAPGMALFEGENSTLTVESVLGNFEVPSVFTNKSKIGHFFLKPAVFDISIGKFWFQDLNEIILDLPDGAINVYPLGLGSSVIQDENNTLYEYRDDGWMIIGEARSFNLIQAVSIVDIGLYLATIPGVGLELLPFGVDEDADFIPDTMEDYYFTLPNKKDTDDDTIPDNVEIAFGTNPLADDRLEDDDNDGLSNIDELNRRLDPQNDDTDFGGASDNWELIYEYDPLNATDDSFDPDGDGLNNAVESIWNSSPFDKDTDNDGMPDQWEVKFGLDPTDPKNAFLDPDDDGKSNIEEYRNDTDPLIPDPPPIFANLYWAILIVCLVFSPIVFKIQRSYLKD